ncbi:hypothetical protein AI2888V1_1387 [Klebsiella pneumoniae]|uniref:MASE1 domain-containing protein n=1 Tax=Klebsiella pneumoniae TaxID=573 RepID=UPI001D267D1E|nr:hypothetical protein AI2888V1_1387 [Klebsiella pneumoniae]CAH5178340.1 hypothetical protein AI2888V1_1387 [Klebsiella pneumoniae]
MLDKININIKKTLLAFIICLVAIPLARFISPQTIIDGNLIYIAWLPISVMFSVIFIFGRYAIAPLILAFAITNSFLIKLTLPQAFILLFCQLFAVFVSCAILRLLWGSAGAAVQRQNIWGRGSSGAASSRRCS